MPDGEEKRIREELAQITKKIDTILKKVREPSSDETSTGPKSGPDSGAATPSKPSTGVRKQPPEATSKPVGKGSA